MAEAADILQPTGLVPDGFETVYDQLARNRDRFGDRIAARSVEDGKSLTWEKLHRETTRVAYLMHAMGIRANDRIAVLGENTIDNLILYYGIQAYGATYCTVNTEINPHHLSEMLDRIGPKAVFWQKELEGTGITSGGPGTWIPYGPYDGEDDGLFAMLASLPDNDPPYPVNGPEDRAVISFTSGTSAAPKGVLHCFSNYYAIAQHQRDRWSLTENDRVLEFRSWSWASAHMLSLNPVLLTGAELLMAKQFSRSRFFGWIAEYSPTVIIAVPTVVNILLEAPPEHARRAFDGVRFVSCSTAPLAPEAHRRFEDIYGVPLVQLYGMSEGGVVCANRPETRRIGSVGKPGMYQDVTAIGPDGAPLPAGEEGRLVTISAQHAQAYLHADGTLEAIRGTPLETGDLGYIGTDGFVHVTGRARDVIIRGGVNIAPLEIENALMTLDGVAEAAVFGMPDSIQGETVACLVVAKTDTLLTKDDIFTHCGSVLPEAKRPQFIEITTEIPKNDRGKIDRNAIREKYTGKQEA